MKNTFDLMDGRKVLKSIKNFSIRTLISESLYENKNSILDLIHGCIEQSNETPDHCILLWELKDEDRVNNIDEISRELVYDTFDELMVHGKEIWKDSSQLIKEFCFDHNITKQQFTDSLVKVKAKIIESKISINDLNYSWECLIREKYRKNKNQNEIINLNKCIIFTNLIRCIGQIHLGRILVNDIAIIITNLYSSNFETFKENVVESLQVIDNNKISLEAKMNIAEHLWINDKVCGNYCKEYIIENGKYIKSS